MSERVRITREGSIARVTLSRPDKHNALDWDMLKALDAAAASLERDRDLRGVILEGDGPSFCSGLDFPTFTKTPALLARAFAKVDPRSANLFQSACIKWRRLPVPVAAAIHGRCFGGGIQIALAADFRFATPDAELAIMEAKYGLIPDMSAGVTLRELMPIDQAKRLTMTGEVFSATRAKELNLLTEIADDPVAEARTLLEQIATRSPDSTAATKRLYHAVWAGDEGAALAQETFIQALLIAGQNFRAALGATRTKKPPKFGPRSRLI